MLTPYLLSSIAINVAIPISPKSVPSPGTVMLCLQCHDRPLHCLVPAQEDPVITMQHSPCARWWKCWKFQRCKKLQFAIQPPWNNRSRCRGQHSSCSPGRQSCHHSSNHSKSHSPSHSACTPISLTNLIADVPPSGTPRTASRSSQQTVSETLQINLKVPYWLREHLAAKSLFYTRLQLPVKNRYQADDHEDQPWCSGEYYPHWAGTRSFSPKKLMRPGTLSPIPLALQPIPGSHVMVSLSPC